MEMFDVSEHNANYTCIHSLGNEPTNTEVLPRKGFDLAKSLESVYPLLNIIFSKLTYDDLMSCQLVKKSWKDIACSELKKRNRSSWVVLERLKDCSTAPATLKTSPNFQYSSCTLAFYVYNYKMLQMNNFVCSHNTKSETNSVKRMTFNEYIRDYLSSRYLKNYCYLSADNISSPYFTRTTIIGDSKNILAAVFLPEIPGIRVKMFKCLPKNIKREIQCEVKGNELFRCILTFTFNDTTTTSAIAKLLSFSSSNTLNDKKLAFGGGLVDSLTINTTEQIYRNSNITFISFLQDKNAPNCTFEAYSVVLNECEELTLRSRLEKFQEQVKFKSQSVLFKFTCCYKEGKDIEDEILKDYFKSSVLIGMDVNGEIGINNVEVDAKYDLGSNFYHGYTTVLVLITW